MGYFKVRARRHDRSWVTQSDRLISKQKLRESASILLDAIRTEIDRERAMEAGKKHGKLPKGPRFPASFRCVVVDSSIEIQSNWPNLDALIEGRRKYKMPWLTQQSGVDVVPMEGPDHTTIFRMTPKLRQYAWVHPGVRKHEFLTRAIERALPKIERVLGEGILRELSSLPPI